MVYYNATITFYGPRLDLTQRAGESFVVDIRGIIIDHHNANTTHQPDDQLQYQHFDQRWLNVWVDAW